MENTILIKLQKKYEDGGYALVSDKGQVLAYGEDMRKLYQVIEKKRIDDKRGVVWFIPSPHQICAF